VAKPALHLVGLLCTRRPSITADCRSGMKVSGCLHRPSREQPVMTCELCGRSLRPNNTIGVCTTNPECERENHRRLERRRRGADPRTPMRPRKDPPEKGEICGSLVSLGVVTRPDEWQTGEKTKLLVQCTGGSSNCRGIYQIGLTTWGKNKSCRLCSSGAAATWRAGRTKKDRIAQGLYCVLFRNSGIVKIGYVRGGIRLADLIGRANRQAMIRSIPDPGCLVWSWAGGDKVDEADIQVRSARLWGQAYTTGTKMSEWFDVRQTATDLVVKQLEAWKAEICASI
jgi:hypothetical protein